MYTVGAIVQRTLLGWVPDRLGRLRATVASLCLYAAVLAATSPLHIAWIPALAIVLGMAHGAAYPAATALTADLCAASERGRATAWFAGFFNLGFAVAASGLPRVGSGLGYRGMIGLGAALLAVAAWFVPRWVNVDHTRVASAKSL
jgi:MFS family permease